MDFEVQAHDVSEARAPPLLQVCRSRCPLATIADMKGTIEHFLWAFHQRDLCNWTAADFQLHKPILNLWQGLLVHMLLLYLSIFAVGMLDLVRTRVMRFSGNLARSTTFLLHGTPVSVLLQGA